jgi:hypothetical protein
MLGQCYSNFFKKFELIALREWRQTMATTCHARLVVPGRPICVQSAAIGNDNSVQIAIIQRSFSHSLSLSLSLRSRSPNQPPLVQ